MEIFKKAFECALAHEKNKTAIRTRRTYKKQISALEKTIVGLQSVIVSKDSSIAGMGHTIDELNAHLDTKKSEIEGLEGDLRNVKSALEDKDKVHVKVLQKLHVQSTLFTNTRRQLEQVTKENEDQSNQIWRMLEENCFLNKRILELDLEVQSLESLLSKLKTDLEAAEVRANFLGQSLKHSRDGYDIKSREVFDISIREKQLRASVLNLQEELEQWRRNVHPIPVYVAPCEANNDYMNQRPAIHDASLSLCPTGTNSSVDPSFAIPLPNAPIPYVLASALQQPLQAPALSSHSSPSSTPSVSPSESPSTSPVVSPPTSPPRASSVTTSRPIPSSRHPLLTPFTPSILSYLNTNTTPSTPPQSPPVSSFPINSSPNDSTHSDSNYLDTFANFSP